MAAGPPWRGGPYSHTPLCRRHAAGLGGALARFDELVRDAAAAGRPVITHGEPHPGNILRSAADRLGKPMRFFFFLPRPRSVYDLLVRLVFVVPSDPLHPNPTLYNQINMSETTVRKTVILGSGCSGLTAAIYTTRATSSRSSSKATSPAASSPSPRWSKTSPDVPKASRVPNSSKTCKAGIALRRRDRMALVCSRPVPNRPFSVDGDDLHADAHHRLRRLRPLAGLPSEQALIGTASAPAPPVTASSSPARRSPSSAAAIQPWKRRRSSPASPRKVTMIHRSEQFRASKIMLERARANPKIQMLTDTIVEEVLDAVKERSHRPQVPQPEDRRPVFDHRLTRCFSASDTSRTPAIFGQLDLDDDGYMKTEQITCSSPAVIAPRRIRLAVAIRAGPPILPQAITAAGTGCMAALEVEKFLEELGR